MLDSDSPVEGDETLLRVVPARPHLYDFDTHSPKPTSFIPNDNDPDGLSMYRRRDPDESPGFLIAAELRARQTNPKTRDHGGVARLLASDAAGVKLPNSATPLRVVASYKPEENDLPGHVLLPDLARVTYDTDPDRVRELALRLSRLCVMEIEATPVPPKT